MREKQLSLHTLKYTLFLGRLHKYRIPLFTLLGVLFIDQFIKIYIKLHFKMGEEVHVADWFIIHFTENPGMAFGFEFGGDYGKLILSVFRILACIGGAFYIRYIIRQKEHIGFVFSVALILAGAIGNILDSVFYGFMFSESTDLTVATFMPADGGYAGVLHGKVVDMFYFPIWAGEFPGWFPIWGGESFEFFRPVFNFADLSISVGVGLIILFQKKFTKKKVQTTAQAETENTEPQQTEIVATPVTDETTGEKVV